MDLALDLNRVDGAADIVRGGDAFHLHRAEPRIDLDLRHLRGKGIACIGCALPVLIERRRRRVEVTAAGEHVAALIRCRQRAEIDFVDHAPVTNKEPSVTDCNLRRWPSPRARADALPQILRAHPPPPPDTPVLA